MRSLRVVCFGISVLSILTFSHRSLLAESKLQVGAAVVDVTPNQLPVLINGSFLSKSSDQVKTRVNARAIVVEGGSQRIALVVLDSCMVPKVLLDDAKQRAAKQTQIAPDHMMISATHTHSAPSVMGALGTEVDMTYVPFLRQRIVEAIVQAEANLQPARVGWGSGDASQFTAVRRWIRRSDRIDLDPFGNPTVHANMHAARNKDDVTGPSGPEDPELSMIAFESLSGEPIAVLANFSMHYFGDQPISADYFGLFCDGLQEQLAKKATKFPPVVALSHGCSGDIWRRDYSKEDPELHDSIVSFTDGLLQIATEIHDQITYEESTSIVRMAEKRLPLKYRVPNQQRLQWARKVLESVGDRPPRDRTEVYAREQILLDQLQETSVVVQGIRIGDCAIATTPNETYALTGLKIKAQSPLQQTMVIELANGGDGYIPPPEQHYLGGYNTWPARSAGLEVTAEPKITAAAIQLLETVTNSPRRASVPPPGEATNLIFETNPVAYFRLEEMEAPLALDASSNQNNGHFEPGVVFYLPGVENQETPFSQTGHINRCAHFAGGRLSCRIPELLDSHQVTLWIWNGMPVDGRETTGWFLSNDHPHGISANGLHLGIGGTDQKPGHLILQLGNRKPIVGQTVLDRWQWYRVTLSRTDTKVTVTLGDAKQPEVEVEVDPTTPISTWFVGGRSDNEANFEGRIDEVVFTKQVP